MFFDLPCWCQTVQTEVSEFFLGSTPSQQGINKKGGAQLTLLPDCCSGPLMLLHSYILPDPGSGEE